MKTINLQFLSFLTCLGSIQASTVLYQNDFENPTGFSAGPTYQDLSQQPVNDLYGQPGFIFQQAAGTTVEAFHITGGNAWGGAGYSDPSGIGGNYSIGMLETIQDDKLSLTFDSGIFQFLNLGMDISAIALDPNVGVVSQQPTFRVSLYDSPGSVFNINSPGTLLDTLDVTGTWATSNNVFDWTSVIVPLDTSASTDGNVSIVFDLIDPTADGTSVSYASFDNLIVVASDTAGAVPEPTSVALLGLGSLNFLVRRRRKSV